MSDAVGDRIRRPSRDSFNNAKPRCLSAFHPKAETTRKIFWGKEDSTRCTVPILTGHHEYNNPMI